MNTKTCYKCGECLSTDLFHKRSDKKDKLSPKCKKCSSEYVKKHYKDNKESIIDQHREYVRNNIDIVKRKQISYKEENKEKMIFTDARRRATKKGISFDITLDDVHIPDICPVLGIPIIKNHHFTETCRGTSPNSPSLDRIDNSKGYIKGNICVISHRANSLKRDANLDELLRVVEYMRLHLNKPDIQP